MKVIKSSIMLGVALALVLGSAQVTAGRYGGHNYGNRHGGHYYGNHYGGRHYGNHYGGRHYGHRGSYAPYFVGGILLGALLSPPRYQPPPTTVYVPQPVYAPPRVVYSQPAPVPSTPSGRRLLRTLNGECFEREFDSRGTELRKQLPASECAW